MKKLHTLVGPYIRSQQTTSKMMRHLFLALLPVIGFAFYKNGIDPYLQGKTNLYGMFQPLLFIGLGTISSYFIELFYTRFCLKKKGTELKETIRNSFAFFPGLFLSLILPLNTPFWMLILGCFIATIIGKMIYGGFGYNLFNPALIGRLFIITLYATVIAKQGGYFNPSELDAVSSSTPLSNVALAEGIGSYATLVKPFGSLWDFFFGTIPGAVGETSAFCCLLGFFILTFTRTIKVKIPLSYIATVFVMTAIIGLSSGLGMWYPTFQILSGGLFFGAIFMATDPVTTPVTPTGQVLFGIGAGILTVVFRYLTPMPEGVLTSILLMNLLVVILDHIGVAVRGKVSWKAVTILIPIISAILLSFSIRSTLQPKTETPTGDPNFKLLETKEQNGEKIYIASQKGNGGMIKAELHFQNGKAISYIILEHHETPNYYALVEKENYINRLLEEQERLEQVDSVSGATISSNALRKLLQNVKGVDHEEG